MEQPRAAYEDLFKIDPENTQALNNLAYMKAAEGALGLAQRALQRSPNDPNISDTLGLIYIRKKLTGPAVEILRDLVARAYKPSAIEESKIEELEGRLHSPSTGS